MKLKSSVLQNKVILVTGASRGIGRAIASECVLHGAIVYANARKEDALTELIKEIPVELQNNIIPCIFDVTNSEESKQVFLKISKEQKRLDCLVNNAGIMKDALIGMVTRELMNELFTTNVYALLEMLQFATKLMQRQNSGSIINVSSLIGTNGNPGQIAYSATKGAVISITKTAAKELAIKNIRVNAIAPGVIDTGLLANVGEQAMENIKSRIGMRRIGSPEEVADVVVFLASDLSRYVTGQIIGIDGATVI